MVGKKREDFSFWLKLALESHTSRLVRRTWLVILSSAEQVNWIATAQGFLFDEVFEFIVTKRREILLKLEITEDWRLAADLTLLF